MASGNGTSAWEVRFSNSRQVAYFFNRETGASEWEPPKGLSDVQIRRLPGADKYLTPVDRNKHSEGGQAGGRASAPNPNESVRARHILAKHTKSRRPSSWRQPVITRSRDEALQIIQAHIDTLSRLSGDQQHDKFKEIAKTESDCSSAKAGGDLGHFTRGSMQASFEAASFALAPGQMSGIVETDSGVHVIYRVA